MATRCKVVCSFKDENQRTVYLHPVYSGSSENEHFFATTPGGQINLNLVNESTLARFEQGKEYYMDFTPCE